MDLSWGSSNHPNATALEVQPATDPPQGSSSAEGNPPEVSAVAMEPSQDLSTTSESETILGSPEEEPSAENNIAWDVQSVSIVICLSFLDCRVRIIHGALQAYGYSYSLRAVIARLHRYELFKHGKVRHPTNGLQIRMRNPQSGTKSTMTLAFVNAEPTVIRYQSDKLQARTPLYIPLICNTKGREIIVELSQGQFVARVSDHPDPKRNQFLMDTRAEYQLNQAAWKTWEAIERFKL